MKRCSAQFVLLVLLCSSLGLAEGSSLRIVDELIGKTNAVRLTQRGAGGTTTRPMATRTGVTYPADGLQLPSAVHRALRLVWTMSQPAADAAAIQATTSNARA